MSATYRDLTKACGYLIEAYAKLVSTLNFINDNSDKDEIAQEAETIIKLARETGNAVVRFQELMDKERKNELGNRQEDGKG